MKKINLRNYAQIAADLHAAGWTSDKTAKTIIAYSAAGKGCLCTCDRAFYLLIAEM